MNIILEVLVSLRKKLAPVKKFFFFSLSLSNGIFGFVPLGEAAAVHPFSILLENSRFIDFHSLTELAVGVGPK